MGVQHIRSIILIFLSSFIFLATSKVFKRSENFNDRPIIGILSQEISYKLNNAYPGKYDSYIAASYVKFIEGAGARVVPIWIGQNEEYYRNLVHNVNGILWPGGSTRFNQSQGYADAGNIIYRLATEINEQGGYFPILGICLGFELMTYVAANRNEHRTKCSAQKIALPLIFSPDVKSSKMFMNAPSEIIDILQYKNVSANFHKFCVTRTGLDNAGLSTAFRVTSTSDDKQGVKFISTLEHKTYPFYGLQFHPEKNLYEWITERNIPHGDKASRAAQYFANFFVNEARKNLNKFSSEDEETGSLIYNYRPTYTGQLGSAFEQSYLFNADVRNRKQNIA